MCALPKSETSIELVMHEWWNIPFIGLNNVCIICKDNAHYTRAVGARAVGAVAGMQERLFREKNIFVNLKKSFTNIC